MRKVILTILAIVFLILGIIGLLLPVIPQVPFLATSAILFCTVNKKFKKWLNENALYQKYLKKYVDQNEKLSKIMNGED